jgi:hypothetical protein
MVTLETAFALVVVGPGIDATYPLSRRALTIGRSRAAMPDIEISDADAAPRHCIVQWNMTAGGHALRVFGVTGAWLNGALLRGDGAIHPLAPGDEFRIGATTFKYRTTATTSEADAPVFDVPTVHAAPTSREVYEFEVLPRIVEAGVFDWKRPLVSYGPRRRVEAPMQAVRVVITKGAPRPAIVAALKHIVDLIESSGSVTDRAPAPLVTLSQWFE